MTIDELLDEHTTEIAALTRRLLGHLAAATDWSETRVYAGWHGVGLHHVDLGYVVGIFPRADSVRVLFEHGHMLGEAPYLDGSGQTRFVDFECWDDARLATVDDLLDRALSV
ncbi:MAG: hypothetical protein QNJ77_01275 [Acidimicrobiia bacterium]|nr:hypothetical protein [Acidimicrobiia bacterium]